MTACRAGLRAGGYAGWGSCTDTVDYSNSTVGMTVKLDQTSTYATQFGVVTYTVDGSASTASGINEDILRKIENIVGSSYADTLTGNEKANVIDGGAGADTINGGAGSDTVDYKFIGTLVSYSGIGPSSYDGSNGVDIDLLRTLQKGTIAEGDRLVSIENVSGSYGHDLLKGTNAGNRLDGGDGDDIIEGRGGNDTIRAAAGSTCSMAAPAMTYFCMITGTQISARFPSVIGAVPPWT